MEENIRIGGGDKLLSKDGCYKREGKKGTEGLHWEQTSLLGAEVSVGQAQHSAC